MASNPPAAKKRKTTEAATGHDLGGADHEAKDETGQAAIQQPVQQPNGGGAQALNDPGIKAFLETVAEGQKTMGQMLKAMSNQAYRRPWSNQGNERRDRQYEALLKVATEEGQTRKGNVFSLRWERDACCSSGSIIMSVGLS